MAPKHCMVNMVTMAAMLGAALFLPVIEALRGSSHVTSDLGTVRIDDEFPFTRHVEASKRMEPDIIQNMSITRAFDVLQKLNTTAPELLKELQQSLANRNKSTHSPNLMSRNLRLSKEDVASPENHTAEVQGLAVLNNLIYGKVEQLDNLALKCDTLKRSGLKALESSGREVSKCYSLSTQTQGQILEAQKDESDFNSQLTSLDREVKAQEADCDTQHDSLNTELILASRDLVKVQNLSSFVSCNDATSTATLLQCHDPRTNRRWEELQPHPGMIEAMSRLESAKVRQFIAKQGVFVERSSVVNKHDIQKYQQRAIQLCSLQGNSSDCPLMLEKYVDILGNAMDSKNRLQNMLERLRLRCKEALARLGSRREAYHSLRAETSIKLTKAIKEKQSYDSMVADEEAAKATTQREYDDNMLECKRDMENMLEEKCAFKKVRSQMLHMAGLPSEIVDCEVSPWVPSPCSKACTRAGEERGLQSLLRTQSQPPQNGSACPPFELHLSCNEQECPEDCAMEDWTGWGECTAFCGGGVQSRARDILRMGNAQGKSCEKTSETRACNNHACDKDCVLSEWTQWSAECSKPCGGGRQSRLKELKEAQEGDGTCPGLYDHSRFQYNAVLCKAQACPQEGNLVCQAKLDVILVLDGSASLGLDGWENIKMAAVRFASRMSGEVNLAVLLFSGPKEPEAIIKCAGLGEGAYDQESDCDMKWKAHLPEKGQEQNRSEIVISLRSMEWPKGSTFTSMALFEAKQELNRGRGSAKSVVIVFTDGTPYSPDESKTQSEELMEQATLVWVPAGPRVQDVNVFRTWSSRPVEDHVIAVRNFSHLIEDKVLNMIISDFCTNVTLPEVDTLRQD